MSYEGDIHRGVWAGDRFDIVTLEEVKSDSGDEVKWEDVSDEVVEEMDAIWESKFEDQWNAE